MGAFIIAEAGLNFSGSVDKALKMVDAAKRAGADAVKFQAFLPSFDSGLARFTLTLEQWQKVFGHAMEQGILFMCTPFDRWAFDMLRDFGVKHWKVPSGELTNDDYLRAIPPQAEFYYLSTGMATEAEIDHALSVLPNPLDKDICLLYCISGYPVGANELGLGTILKWNLIKYPAYTIGFSDHSVMLDSGSIGWCASLAVALGAQIIERHFMLEWPFENTDDIPDEEVSLPGTKLDSYISFIRLSEEILKEFPKGIQPCEEPTLKVRNRVDLRQ